MSLDVLPQCHLSEEGLGTVFAFVAPLDCLHFALECATLPGLDVVISQLVLGEQGLHGVRSSTDFTGKHRIVQIRLPFAFSGGPNSDSTLLSLISLFTGSIPALSLATGSETGGGVTLLPSALWLLAQSFSCKGTSRGDLVWVHLSLCVVI